MEIGARLHHLLLHTPNPDECAQFYSRVYGMSMQSVANQQICVGPDRRLTFANGSANELGYAGFAFQSSTQLEAYRRRIELRIDVHPVTSPFFDRDAFGVLDSDGNRIVFGIESDGAPRVSAPPSDAPPARLQHFAVRSSDPAKLSAFYRDTLGFVISDRVYDDASELRACFLRTDAEHHAMAIFHAEERRHDHLSFETTDWIAVRDWADRVVSLRVPIVWGVGRHGPGNDTFFMVRDPDGNLVEISAELEVCEPTRPAGVWRHEQKTLNQWGSAIMRS